MNEGFFTPRMITNSSDEYNVSKIILSQEDGGVRYLGGSVCRACAPMNEGCVQPLIPFNLSKLFHLIKPYKGHKNKNVLYIKMWMVEFITTTVAGASFILSHMNKRNTHSQYCWYL